MSATVFTPAPAALGSNVTHQHDVNRPEVVAYVCQCPGPYHECPYSSWCACDQRICSRCEYQPGFSRLKMRVILDGMVTEDNYISDEEVQSYYNNLVKADVDAAGDSGC